MINIRQGKVFLRDLNSVNGLYVRVSHSTQLVDGDIVRLGRQSLRFTHLTPEPHSLKVRVNTTSTHSERPKLDLRLPPPASHVEPAPIPEPPTVATDTPARADTPEPADTPAQADTPAPELPEGLAVTFQPSGQLCPLKVGDALCDIAKAAGVPLSTDCEIGICGEDPVRVIAGGDNLSPKSEEEQQALSTICGLDGPEYRLACVTTPRGPVVVELVE